MRENRLSVGHMPRSEVHSLERSGINLRCSSIFDPKWYRTAYADVGYGIDPMQHFLDLGWAQLRGPNAFMDPNWYLAQYPDLCGDGADPFSHYMQSGWREGCDPGPWFSTSRYCIANPDVRNTGINPLLHFYQLGRMEGLDPLGLSSFDPGMANMRIRAEDIGSAAVAHWMAELAFHGRAVCTHVVHPRSLKHRAVSIFEGLWGSRHDRVKTLLVSINGAGLTPRIVKAAGRGLIVVFESMAAARGVSPGLRTALVRATVATSSPGIAALLTVNLGLPPRCYAEPMSGAYLQADSRERTIPVVWFCPSPRALRGKPLALIQERRAIAHRLAPFGLQIVGDAGWRQRPRTLAATLDVRSDWATLSCALEGYAAARIALVTPPPGQEEEITADMLVAMASGALPIAPYTMARALFNRFGDDCPIPLYKDVGEVAAIVEHYLREEDERVALVNRCVMRLLDQPSYSALIGDLVRSVTLRA